jgi:hypothetical protein
MTSSLHDQTVLVVNAISPGVVDTGAWDALGEQGKAPPGGRL